MSTTSPFLVVLLGFNAGILVLGMAASIYTRFRRTLLEGRAASVSAGSGGALFLGMVLFHPKSWLILGLVGYGVYFLVSRPLSAATLLFCWGVAAGATALIAFALLVQSRRKRMASIKGSSKSHVA